MKNKKFDCVAMKRRGAERIHEQTGQMTSQQRLLFWQERTKQLRRRQDELRQQDCGGR